MHAIIFDLDGTLIDSAPDIHAAINRVMADLGQPAFEFSQVRSYIGNGVQVLLQRVMAARDLDPADHGALVSRFLAYYEADAATLTRPYPNAIETLNLLRGRGHRLGICTNKPEAPTQRILKDFGLTELFDIVIGGDTLPQRKPDPAPLLHARAAMDNAAVIFVGDSEVDAETAERARIPFALFTEGYRKSDLREMAHNASFSDFVDLPDALARLIAIR